MFESVAILGVTILSALWAGMLALSEESPIVQRSMVDGPSHKAKETAKPNSVQVGRIVLLMVSGSAASYLMVWWVRSPGWATATVMLTVGFLYMLAEALPRALGSAAPELATAANGIARRSVIMFRPLAHFANIGNRLFAKLVPVKSTDDDAISMAQRDLVYGVHSLGGSTAEEIMTPRLDVVALDEQDLWQDVVDLVRRAGHARLPVYKETLDHITGILFAKDLVPAVAGVAAVPKRWQDLVKPVAFVPESKPLAELLRDFQKGAAHMAVVVDEFGGTAGVVTLEDILEEVVGEIHDEYDEEEQPLIAREGNDKFWVDGGLALDELSTLLETDLERDDINTVGGLVYSEMGRVPNPGDEFSLAQFRIVVEQVVRRRIRRVYFERIGPTAEPQKPESAE